MNRISKYTKERYLRMVYIILIIPVLAIIHFSSNLISVCPGAQGGTGGW